MTKAHLRYKHRKTYDDYVGARALKHVADIVERLKIAVNAEYVGDGNAKVIKKLSPGARMGDNRDALLVAFACRRNKRNE